MGRVELHTGNPGTTGPRTTKASRNRTVDPRLKSAPCTWCGGKSTSKSASRRCKRCRKLELIIESAARFISANGLRALDRSGAGGSSAETKHRSEAARAKKTLNGIKRERLSKGTKAKARRNVPRDPAAKIVKQIADMQVALVRLASKISELEASESSTDRDRQLEVLRSRRAGFELGIARRRAKL